MHKDRTYAKQTTKKKKWKSTARTDICDLWQLLCMSTKKLQANIQYLKHKFYRNLKILTPNCVLPYMRVITHFIHFSLAFIYARTLQWNGFFTWHSYRDMVSGFLKEWISRIICSMLSKSCIENYDLLRSKNECNDTQIVKYWIPITTIYDTYIRITRFEKSYNIILSIYFYGIFYVPVMKVTVSILL